LEQGQFNPWQYVVVSARLLREFGILLRIVDFNFTRNV